MKTPRPSLKVICIVLCCLTLTGTRPTIAHNKVVHDEMTKRAYRIMVLASRRFLTNTVGSPPAGITLAQWKEFHKHMFMARFKLAKLAGNADPNGTSPVINQTTADKLATASSEPDYHTDDIHLFIKLSNAAGQSVATKIADEAVKAGAAALLIPIVCAADCFAELFGLGSGTCKKCVEKAKDLAQDVPTPSDLTNLIPGFGDISSNDHTGVWHFINMSRGTPAGAPVNNTYDDHQGLFYEKAGPIGIPGGVDILILAGTDLVGLSVNPEESEGVKRYQIAFPGNSNDSFPDDDKYTGTLFRSNAQWQKYAMGHMEFEPVDNFALWGWRGFRSNNPDVFPGVNPKLGRISHLGYPLHALGDATVPMHVTGTTSWGHRPFEDAHENLWKQGKISEALDDQVILAQAFKYRQEILDWRAAGHPEDIPIRHLVRAVARNTYDYSMKMQLIEKTWPFDDAASVQYLTADAQGDLILKENSINTYSERSNAVKLVKPLLQDGIAAELAFLISATELSDISQKTQAFPAADLAFSTPRWPTAAVAPASSDSPGAAHHAQPQARETRAQAQLFRAVKMNYALLARQLIQDQISPAEYLQRVWNQSSKAQAASKDPAMAEEAVRADRDGDLVPDARDRCPDTPPLTATDAVGCPTRERLPNAPSRRDMQNLFRDYHILVSPKCQSAPAPPTPSPLKIGTSSLNRDLLFAVSPVKNQPADCLTFYQIGVQFIDVFEGNKQILPEEAYREFVFRNTDSKELNPQPPQPRFVFRIPRAPEPVLADHKFLLLAWGRYTSYQWRVRAFNANGLASPWSAWRKVDPITFGEP